MVLLGFADVAVPDPLFNERAFSGEAEHVVWSVPPQAAAGLIDRRDAHELDVRVMNQPANQLAAAVPTPADHRRSDFRHGSSI